MAVVICYLNGARPMPCRCNPDSIGAIELKILRKCRAGSVAASSSDCLNDLAGPVGMPCRLAAGLSLGKQLKTQPIEASRRHFAIWSHVHLREADLRSV